MSKLEGWLPFRFRRNKSENKETAAAKAAGEKEGAQATAQPQHPLAPFFSAPMAQLLGSMGGEPFFRDAFSHATALDRWFGDFAPARFSPTLDVVDEETSLRVSAELPGMSKNDIKLSIDDDLLVIQGEKKNEEESKEHGVFRSERYYGYFKRTVPLPSEIEADKAAADFKDGVLTVRFPKQAKPMASKRSIEIKS
ncbi:MAG: Hsp20/alpha crystallin family protein [Myxococcales bacterium]|nr:Hsp20/alpha crystallin family protein [Myxococcales bacterium]MDD9970168.1 Hsp20/alpha crystallin family protein [Myxococcales bacterium]